MKQMVGACLTLTAALGACASDQDPGLRPASEPNGIQVEAQQDVMVSAEPLGDVVNGRLNGGQSATALCFVRQAQTNAGFRGSAIKVDAGSLVGYAAVTDFPDEPTERQMLFDIDEDALRTRLPSCPG